MRIGSQCVEVDELSSKNVSEMYALFTQHYVNADVTKFERDLEAKRWVIQLVNETSGKLCGFSTQVVHHYEFDGNEIAVLFSGDTIVDPSCWSETALMREWGRLIVRQVEAAAPAPLYWFLISKGYKTYRFMPVFFREFFPRFECATPAWAQRMIDVIACQMFGDEYDARRGLVLASSNKDRLRTGVADVTEQRLNDPHVRYFLDRNPKHAAGDELCCIARLDVHNFTAAGVRLLDPENRPVDALRSRAC